MIVRASGFGMGVGRLSKLQRGVGVLAMPDAELDTMQCIESVCEVPPGAGGQRLLVPGMAVRVFIGLWCVPEGVEHMRRVISAMQGLFSQDKGVEF